MIQNYFLPWKTIPMMWLDFSFSSIYCFKLIVQIILCNQFAKWSMNYSLFLLEDSLNFLPLICTVFILAGICLMSVQKRRVILSGFQDYNLQAWNHVSLFGEGPIFSFPLFSYFCYTHNILIGYSQWVPSMLNRHLFFYTKFI